MSGSKLYGYKNLRETYVDHNGNYADYFFLEDPKSTLYGKQLQVPQLPVPELKHTLEMFLRSAKPYCSTPQEHSELEKLCAEMLQPTSFTQTLHSRLLERAKLAKKNNTSWFVNWWNQWAYLAYRDSVVHNVTYELLMKDECESQMRAPTRRAARFAFHALKYRQQVVLGTLSPDVSAKNAEIPWENSQHKYVFNCCRMPGQLADVSRTYAPDLFPHVVVTYQNRFFKFNVIRDAQSQEPVSVDEIHAQLDRIVEMSKGSAAAPQVGILTATHRDTWFANRKVLEIGNHDALEQVQSAVFLIALDLEAQPASRRDVARHMLHGGPQHASNRFWDKSFQIVVAGNGKLAFVGEHSMTDGMTTTRLVNYVLDKMFAEKESQLGVPDRTGAVLAAPPSEIVFKSTPQLDQLIAAAWQEQRDMTAKKEFEILMFYGYGADKIKTFGVSPDAYAQVAIQLANRKVFGQARGTYESTQTRTYMHGRTEVTRSVSVESEQFLDAVCLTRGLTNQQLYAKLSQACAHHSAYTQQASKANGCDRHMLGLKLSVQDGEEVPALFKHPITAKSGTWQISTSGLTGELMDGWCFGEVHPDGVGIGYSVQKKRLRFSVTSCHVEDKWAERMCAALEEALVQMASICEAGAPAAPTKAKL